MIALSLLLAAGLAHAEVASPAPKPSFITPEMDKWIMEGIDDVYRMKFDRAEEDARKVIALNPDHPHAYLILAGVAWTRYVYETDQGDDSLIELFEERAKKAKEVGNKWLKAHPDDAPGLMTVGAAYGVASRLAIVQHRWVAGYWDGRTALKLTKRAIEADPQLWDAYLGTGMYDYYSDLYPRFIGVLAKIVLRGNRVRGIEQLNLVAEKGHYSKSNARILLVEISTEDPFGYKNPKRAVAIMDELSAKYTEGAMMHSARLVAWFTDGQFERSAASAREYLKLADEGKYNAIEKGKGGVILGVNLWALGKHDEAAAAFEVAQGVLQFGRLSRWAVWSHIVHGQMLDSLGRREEALKHYKLAAAAPDRWDFKSIAKGYISKPYAAKVPERIPPP
jgi:tetratricopeptide (TPR) repeat protein